MNPARTSLKWRLTLLQLTVAVVVLLLYSGFFVVSDLAAHRQSTRRALTSMAATLAYHCTAALDFNDREAAATTLGALVAERRVTHAWILLPDGELFAAYRRGGETVQAPPQGLGEQPVVADGHMLLAHPVRRGEEVLGQVVLRYNLEWFRSLLTRSLLPAVGALLATAAIALGLALRLQRTLSEPILALIETARHVARSHDLTVRMPEGRLDEVGELYRGFNAMLNELAARERERAEAEAKIRQLNESLEQRVAERTREVEAANARLLELDRLKSMFLASMSHELRTPLNSILGFSGILLMGLAGPLNPEQTRQLGFIKSSAEHLLNLINDVLDISKIEAGRVDLEIALFPLAEVVEEALQAVATQAEVKGLTLRSEVEGNLVVESDRRRVKQVLLNLLSNAVKFSSYGEVSVRATVDGACAAIRVADQGVGIPSADLPKLFRPFQQVDMSATKRHEGTGLGLYLCHKILTLLHGNISVESEVGRGSVFTFTLPLVWEGGQR